MSPTVLPWHRNAVDGNRTALDLDLDGSMIQFDPIVSFSTEALQILSGHNIVAVNAATWRSGTAQGFPRPLVNIVNAPGVFSEAISAMEIHSRWEEAAV